MLPIAIPIMMTMSLLDTWKETDTEHYTLFALRTYSYNCNKHFRVNRSLSLYEVCMPHTHIRLSHMYIDNTSKEGLHICLACRKRGQHCCLFLLCIPPSHGCQVLAARGHAVWLAYCTWIMMQYSWPKKKLMQFQVVYAQASDHGARKEYFFSIWV